MRPNPRGEIKWWPTDPLFLLFSDIEFKYNASIVEFGYHKCCRRLSTPADLGEEINYRHAQQVCSEFGVIVDNADDIVDLIKKRFI